MPATEVNGAGALQQGRSRYAETPLERQPERAGRHGSADGYQGRKRVEPEFIMEPLGEPTADALLDQRAKSNRDMRTITDPRATL